MRPADATILFDLILRLAELGAQVMAGQATSEDVAGAQVEAGKTLDALKKQIAEKGNAPS